MRIAVAPMNMNSIVLTEVDAGKPPALSVVIPVHNEAGNIFPLVEEVVAALGAAVDYDITFVDDGSEDATGAELAAASEKYPAVRVVRHRARCGQSAALRSGVKAARADWVVTLDGDGQNDPNDIPALLAIRDRLQRPNVVVNGVRAQRRDAFSKRFASRFANGLRRRMLGDGASDTGCGIRLFPRALFLDLPYFDHMHRFLPALFIRAGAATVEAPVNHRPRTRGRSHYGVAGRALVGIVDLIGVFWLLRRGSRPVIEVEGKE
jgi:dolichol-phosphate mannosyltransferase